jgi:phi13 family phage major tail protein
MATTGLKYLVYAPLTEVDDPTDPEVSYTDGKVLAHAIEVGMTINMIDVPLYADDREVDRYKGFSNGTINVNGDDVAPADMGILLGHEVETDTNGMIIITSKGEDEGIYVGLGFFATTRKTGDVKYRAIFLHKVKFAIPNETLRTKGETITFQTPQISGTFITDILNVWKEEAICDTEAAAIAWLNGKSGIT